MLPHGALSYSGRSKTLTRFAVIAACAGLVLGVSVALVTSRYLNLWQQEGMQMADAHRRHSVAHPGWSFPARVYAEGDEASPLGWLIGPDAEIREHLPLERAPRHLIEAIIAAEDRGFRDHGGVSVVAMLRAAFANAEEGGYAQGGSTLTMQLVRTMAERREKTIGRKLREIGMALGIDEALGKDGVLAMYLDAPYLGQRAGLSICGFGAAARHYFGKDAAALDLAEAATLAAILPAPGRFAPDRFPERALPRRNRVLQVLRDEFGYSADSIREALAKPIETVSPEPWPERHPVVLSAIRSYLESTLGPEITYGAGLVVTASIDLDAQVSTERLFPEKLAYYEALLGRKQEASRLQAAGVLLDVETGRIRALYGGTDVTATSFNRATQARRQAGSAFKPVVYALAFAMYGSDGPAFTTATAEPNAPRVFRTPTGDWRPRNIGGEYTPTAALAYALTWSQNIATASLLEEAGGPEPLIRFASSLGFDTSAFPKELGLALGQAEVTPLEMAAFAGLIASGGYRIDPVPVLGAVDAAGVVRIAPPRRGPRVLDPEPALLTRELMRLVVDQGTGGSVRGAGGEGGYGGPVMGKTGTTDGERDVWFMGATPRYAAVVWLGYDRPTGLHYSASDLAAPLWGWWMGRLTRSERPHPQFAEELKLSRRWVCTVTGQLAGPGCRSISAPFVPGTEMRKACGGDHPIPDPPGTRHVEETEAGETRPAYESLWKRLSREATEKAESEKASE